MRRRRSVRAAVVVSAAAVLSMPLGGSAAPILSPVAQCHAVATVGQGTTTCERLFVLQNPRYPSEIESHANFHARTATGTVTMEWYDQVGTLQARFVCDSPGLYVSAQAPTGQGVGGGPADLSSYPNCQRFIRNSVYFAAGVQRLVVTAQASACWSNDNSRQRCEFHGYLVLNQPGLPY